MIPFTTRIFLLLNCLVFILVQNIANVPSSPYSLQVQLILFLHEYYRCITSPFFHGNLMHIGMNMMSFLSLGSTLEKQSCVYVVGGSLGFFLVLLWSVLLTSFLHIFMSAVLYWISLTSTMYLHPNDNSDGGDSYLTTGSIGFSGVLFHLLVLEVYHQYDQIQEQPQVTQTYQRQIMGFINVPILVYPWALLIVLQWILPNVSFLGHLSGLLCGIFHVYGCWDPLFLPSIDSLMAIESHVGHFLFMSRSEGDENHGWLNSLFYRFLQQGRWGYMACSYPPSSNLLSLPQHQYSHNLLTRRNTRKRTPKQLIQWIQQGWISLLVFLRHLKQTVYVILFGYGTRNNQNIRIFSTQEQEHRQDSEEAVQLPSPVSRSKQKPPSFQSQGPQQQQQQQQPKISSSSQQQERYRIDDWEERNMENDSEDEDDLHATKRNDPMESLLPQRATRNHDSKNSTKANIPRESTFL